MTVRATRHLSKAHHRMMCRIIEDGPKYFCQFTLTGRNRSAHLSIEFNTMAEASHYLDRKTHHGFDVIVNFLIEQASQ